MPKDAIRGWKVWSITRDLAEGKTQSSIARMYKISQSTVSLFARDHAEDIAEVRAQLDQAMADLWIADKRKRVAMYEDIAEEMGSSGRGSADDDSKGPRAYISTVEARKAQMQALRSVADELGDIPQRVKIEGGGDPVRHILEGVDPEMLS